MQELKATKPTIDAQINYIRGARHLSAKEQVILSQRDNPMLMAIEETLLAANNWQKLLTKVKDIADEKEFDPDYFGPDKEEMATKK